MQMTGKRKKKIFIQYNNNLLPFPAQNFSYFFFLGNFSWYLSTSQGEGNMTVSKKHIIWDDFDEQEKILSTRNVSKNILEFHIFFEILISPRLTARAFSPTRFFFLFFFFSFSSFNPTVFFYFERNDIYDVKG